MPNIRFWMGFGEHYINVFTVLKNLGLLSEKPVRTARGQDSRASDCQAPRPAQATSSAKNTPAMASRSAPTHRGERPAGARLWAVPVVPHNTAAARAIKTPVDAPCREFVLCMVEMMPKTGGPNVEQRS